MSSTTSHNRVDQRPGWKRSALTASGLSLLFLMVYNATNWMTSQRSDVGTWYYSWERFIPFVPLMIIPYMLIDGFFVAAPFLCATVSEQRLLSRRIVFAILAAGVCFLLFPLQLAVERPHVEGWLGVIFNSFREVDLPYNLCPSLHIALRTILAEHYARHTRGILRGFSHAWFSLIGLSTLLTYQHHVVDVIGGLILGLFCFYFIRETPIRLPFKTNYRVGLYYVLASMVMSGLAMYFGSWGMLLLWPAVACALVASGYFFFGPGVFGKEDGHLPLSSRWILAPVLFGQRLSLWHYRKQCRAWDQVTDRLWIGRLLSEAEANQALNENVKAVVDLTVNFSEAEPFRFASYLQLPVLDLTAPTPEQIDQAVSFIERETQNGIVYVHCKIGYSRSAVIVAAYLLKSRIARDADEAIAQIRGARPTVVIRKEAEKAIREFTAGQTG